MNQGFVKQIIALRGDVGKKWLRNLPSIIKKYEEKWGLVVSSPFFLSYNYVAPARTLDGKDAVLKISFPNNKEFPAEIEALKVFNGQGAIKLLREDLENGIMLLEKAEPGVLLRTIKDDTEQIHIASQVIKILHKSIAQKNYSLFPTIADWGKIFARHRKNYPESRVPKYFLDKAEDVYMSSKNAKETFLLHGDLHSDNILSSSRGWLVIDPKGVIGEREFELAAFLRNPIYDFPKGCDYKKLEAKRILQFSEELGFNKQRILDWAFAGAIISIFCKLEDEGKFADIYLKNAELLNNITL